ncbi:MAG TPA: hypothetical protein VLC98_12685 [Phnomibacter sp.]|nr:hypothetical protein [Phnomibacter sp.]
MVKDKRYKTVNILIEIGKVSEFRDIFEHIPKTKVAEQLGFHFNRITKLIESVKEIKVGDIFLLSDYFEIDSKKMFELIYNQKNNQKPIPKTKRKG